MILDDTVDGRNPAPVDRWFIPLFIGFQPSKVVQDFFHPPYFTCLPEENTLFDMASCHVVSQFRQGTFQPWSPANHRPPTIDQFLQQCLYHPE